MEVLKHKHNAPWHSSDTDVIGHDGKLKKGKDVGFADMTLALSKDGERKTYGPVSVAVAPDGTANVGISEYELNNLIPDDYKSSMPTIEEIERELKD